MPDPRALYHHFESKEDLFRAVYERVEQELIEPIAGDAMSATDSLDALRAGARAFLDACKDRAAQRTALIDVSSVLGSEQRCEIRLRYGFELVRGTLPAAMDAELIERQPVRDPHRHRAGAPGHAGVPSSKRTWSRGRPSSSAESYRITTSPLAFPARRPANRGRQMLGWGRCKCGGRLGRVLGRDQTLERLGRSSTFGPRPGRFALAFGAAGRYLTAMAVRGRSQENAGSRRRWPSRERSRARRREKPRRLGDLPAGAWARIAKRSFDQFRAKGVTNLAAALTYRSVLSLFPALLALVALLGVLGQYPRTYDAILAVARRVAPPSVVQSVSAPLQGVITNKGGTTAPTQ